MARRHILKKITGGANTSRRNRQRTIRGLREPCLVFAEGGVVFGGRSGSEFEPATVAAALAVHAHALLAFRARVIAFSRVSGLGRHLRTVDDKRTVQRHPRP